MALDYGIFPPEFNSLRMYAGAGSGPLLAAAAAWDGLAAELSSAAASYQGVVSGLGTGWSGPAAGQMEAAALPYVQWMNTTAAQAELASGQAKVAAGAYEAAFAATVPPPVIAANRSLLLSLVATNILGQNTPAIMTTEAHYMEMWAQDAAAMYGYAGASAQASVLPQQLPPKQNTNPAGMAAQGASLAHAGGQSGASNTQAMLSQASPAISQTLQQLGTGQLGSGTAATDAVKNVSPYLSMMSAPLSVMSSGASATNSLNSISRAMFTAAGQGLASAGSGLLGGAGTGLGGVGSAGSAGLNGLGATAGLGRAASLGGLSVPQAWAAGAQSVAPPITVLPNATLGTAVPTNPGGMLGGVPLAGMGARAGGAGMGPRFTFRPEVPTVMPRPAVGG